MVSAQTFARVVDQRLFSLHMDAPEFGVRYLVEFLPHSRLISMLGPVLAQIAFEKQIDLRANPGGRVNAVGDRIDWHFVSIYPWPEELPHAARNIAMQRADAVVMAGQTQR